MNMEQQQKMFLSKSELLGPFISYYQRQEIQNTEEHIKLHHRDPISNTEIQSKARVGD